MASHRILYIGQNLTLLRSLNGALEDCLMVRCPGGSLEQALIKSEIRYSLFLLDEELPGITGLELAHFARRVMHRERTPIIILSASKAVCAGAGVIFETPDDLNLLVRAIQHLLAARR